MASARRRASRRERSSSITRMRIGSLSRTGRARSALPTPLLSSRAGRGRPSGDADAVDQPATGRAVAHQDVAPHGRTVPHRDLAPLLEVEPHGDVAHEAAAHGAPHAGTAYGAPVFSLRMLTVLVNQLSTWCSTSCRKRGVISAFAVATTCASRAATYAATTR